MTNLTSTVALAGIPMTALEASRGRFMRGPEGHPAAGGGAAPNPQENPGQGAGAGGNNPGNFGLPGQGGSEPDNNSGLGFDPTSFWDDPSSGDSGSSGRTRESADPSQSGGGSPDNSGGNNQQDPTVSAIANRLQGLQLGNNLMSEQVINELAEGNTQTFHQNLNTAFNNAIRESLLMNAQVLEAAMTQMQGQFQSMIDERFNGRDDDAELIRNFPAAQNPRVAPMIRGVYNQALKHAGGDRAKAVSMTKDMMRIMSQESADDLDQFVAPRSAGDDFRPQGKPTNWVKELLGR